MVDTSGKKTTLTRQWYGTQGLVWTPDGQEIWFTASELGLFHYISAVTLNKQQRLVTRVPGSLVIFDIWKDGRVLPSPRRPAPRSDGLQSWHQQGP